VAFVDPGALVEVGRARAGLQPTALVMDRSGKRGYAFNQGSSNVTVVDLATRAAAGTIPTEAPPARGAFSRSGDRMYLVVPTSAYMTVVAIPSLAATNRVFIGYNAVSVHVDPRNDWVYVSMGDSGELLAFAPSAPLPVARVELPGPATWLSIDDSFDLLLGVIPSVKGVTAMELTSRRLLPPIAVGEGPYAVTVVGERR
jgi:YVTN family beta-propeller protein